MPIFYFLRGTEIVRRAAPMPEAFVLPGLKWGKPTVLFTPAYWMTQYWMAEDSFPEGCHRFGGSLEEEVVACLLGGHGISSEIGFAAFQRLRDSGLLADPNPRLEDLSNSLREPLDISGRKRTYRFWSQKARYILSALRSLRERPIPTEPARALRDQLIKLPGIGLKTGSWIVRNWSGSNDVAILDVHIVRAGRLMGLYSSAQRVDKEYFEMEHIFLKLTKAMKTGTANLDSLIWRQMRSSPRLVASLLRPS
jgi:N-glycosylase/DNA lyase